ncbi:MAG TPA: hypothetical protein VHK67_02070 [Rhabdochlamydiaceae bacterium]|nr:hypothetical protein [Rhabdochlamydiaceae bacterium]
MFKKAIFISALCMAAVSVGWLVKLVYLTDADRVKYVKLLEAGRAVARATKNEQTHQTRGGVRKDLWLSQEDHSRLHYRIESKSSVLTLLPIDDKVDIIENLQHLKCWMQDKLYAEGDVVMQQMRFFEADQGVYQYSTGQFAANSVILSLFRVPGVQLPTTIDPSKAFLQGIAQDVSFSIAGKTTQFQAQKFKATLLTQGSQQEEKP